MWLGLSDGFLSVVRHRDRPENLLICAREREHLDDILPGRWDDIYSIPFSDYAWRVEVKAEEFAEIIKNQIISIQYDEFKKTAKSKKLHDFYLGVWDLGVKIFGFGPKEIIDRRIDNTNTED